MKHGLRDVGVGKDQQQTKLGGPGSGRKVHQAGQGEMDGVGKGTKPGKPAGERRVGGEGAFGVRKHGTYG